MAQQRKPLPKEYDTWVGQYLVKRRINKDLYPNELSTTQWANLKAAFRQIKHSTKNDDKSVINALQQANGALIKEVKLLRKHLLASPTREWVKINFPDINDNNICSQMGIIAKRALGLSDYDYAHITQVNTWLSQKNTHEIKAIIKEAKQVISRKRKASYQEKIKAEK